MFSKAADPFMTLLLSASGLLENFKAIHTKSAVLSSLCVCVCVCVHERERELLYHHTHTHTQT